MQCFENAEDELFNGDMKYDGIDEVMKYKSLMDCNCLPQCSSLKYEIELVKTNYKTHLTQYKSIASLKVFFKDNEFVPLKRFQLYGTVDFLANCGIFKKFKK
jgi:acid-sensing ion channel, other